MSDSLSSTSSEPRMLERRVSNQRSELTNDQQMNYLLAWFNGWSDLQREDFIPVLAEKLSSKMINANGIEENLNSLSIDNGRPPSLFKCQVDLFTDWVVAWSDDQKNYFIIRLKDIDAGFSSKYEHFLEFGKDSPEKDYFEPGVPEGLDFSLTASKESREVPQPKKISFKSDEETRDVESALSPSEDEGEVINMENYQTDDDLCKPVSNLSTIQEDANSEDATDIQD